jgi:hypothetical protein
MYLILVLRFYSSPLTLSVLSQFYKYHFFHLLKHGCTHYMQLLPGRSKRCTRFFYELWIDKTATFNLTPSGVASDLMLTVSSVLNKTSWPLLRGSSPGLGENKRSVKVHRFGLGDAGGPIDSRVCDLCNHVGFNNVAAPRGCWRLFEPKKSPDSWLREGAEHNVAPLSTYI